VPFKSKAQQRMFYAKAKHDPRFAKMADEFASKTKDFKRLPEKYGQSKRRRSRAKG
jgi:hypothetical protein